ncbi:MAG TPA: isochorismate synthase [Opitutaceae bacterium]|nr:isochorismate synthase [Opitutaceae bacterium]
MLTLPLNPSENLNPAALHAFLGQCRDLARQSGVPKLVSISLEVDALDPLAVLESIFEATEFHFYCERPARDFAVAGAEGVVSFEAKGPSRFADCQRFIDETLRETIAVGDLNKPFAGPHFFCSFGFFDDTATGAEFPSARVFVPRWQVARTGDRTMAVANLLVAPEANLDVLVGRVWGAHGKFNSFDYTEPDFSGDIVTPASWTVSEAGGAHFFLDSVKTATGLIAEGFFRKIVLARAQDVEAPSRFHPLALLNGLRQKFPDCYAFSVANGRGGSFIGASPERLARVDSGTLYTEALAGSAPRGRTASEDAALGNGLLKSDKDLREHRLVIDSIMRRLEPLGIQAKAADKPQLVRLSNVQHLHTPIQATLPDPIRPLDVIARLHPTPAVGGSPREEACAHIRRLEAFERGLYAGALGWVGPQGNGEFFVGLRSALVDGNKARLYAGAGIVAGSEPEKEFAETELKFRALREALLPS